MRTGFQKNQLYQMIFRGSYNPITMPKIVHNYEQISDIPNAVLYLSASGLATNTTNTYGTVDNSNKISYWNSLITPQINGVQLTGSNQPTLDIDGNGVKSVLFNGSNYFNFSSLFSLGFCTIVMVFKPTNNITAGSTNQAILYTDNGTRSIVSAMFFGETSGAATNETIDITSWRNPWNNYYFCGSYTRTNIYNNVINKLVINGDSGIEYILNNSPISVYDYLPGSTGYIRVFPDPILYNGTLSNIGVLGASYDGSSGLNGRLYELIIFNRKLYSYEQTYIDYVLNLKYGI